MDLSLEGMFSSPLNILVALLRDSSLNLTNLFLKCRHQNGPQYSGKGCSRAIQRCNMPSLFLLCVSPAQTSITSKHSILISRLYILYSQMSHFIFGCFKHTGCLYCIHFAKALRLLSVNDQSCSLATILLLFLSTTNCLSLRMFCT